MRASKYVFLFLVCLFVLASTSCQSKNKNSFLILAFDRLPSDAINCADEDTANNSGFLLLCKESIRFTHAYTTSLQPAAAMGSIVTGLYPFQNKLHHSQNRLDSSVDNVLALAKQKGLRTAFFSGSPHILKKTGLSDWVDHFDDSAALTNRNYFKNFKQQLEEFHDWQSNTESDFFSIIYNSELEIVNDLDGMTIDKIDEELFDFFQQLKEKDLWDTTHIILVGLNGKNDYSRINETSFTNLHSENTQIALLVKPPRQMGDEGINWKADDNVNLADLGYTLKCSFKPCPANSLLDEMSMQFPQMNLQIYSKKEQSPWSAKARQILIEAPVTNLFLKGSEKKPTRFALIADNELFIEAQSAAYYNTLTDVLETTNISAYKKDRIQEFTLLLKKIRDIKSDPSVSMLLNSEVSPIVSPTANSLENSATQAETFYNLKPDPIAVANLNYILSQNKQRLLPQMKSPENPLNVYLIQYFLKSSSARIEFEKWAVQNKNYWALKYLNMPTTAAKANSIEHNCALISLQSTPSLDDLKKCESDLFQKFLRYHFANKIGLDRKKMELEYFQAKKEFMENIQRQSFNIALENIWGLKTQAHPNYVSDLFFIDKDFF